MSAQPCLFCGGDSSEPGHAARCDGRQGAIGAFDGEAFGAESDTWEDRGWPPPPAAGITPETLSASVEAAAKIEPSADTLRAAVLEHIRRCGPAGATDDEIQAALALDGNTERPRRWELLKADLIAPAGHRTNARGRRCAVWVAPLRQAS